MSKRRKNAGEGYGYLFSGAFNKKADAVKKEKKRKGSFVKAVMTRTGMRYAVMTPRLNPIKRKKKVPPVAPVQNPSELLVLGANPSGNRELNLPAGSIITIRVNPTSAAICGANIGGEQCTRKPGHRGPHLPQGATMRTATRLRRGWKPRNVNPSAEAIREDFTGAPADSYTVHDEPNMAAGDYAQLGELLALYVKPAIGGQVQQINFRHNERPLVVSDTTRRQIYFVGGNQDVSPSLHLFCEREQSGGLYELGEARRIDYKQRKEHVPDPDVDEWRHEFGEESGVRPKLMFDPIHKQLLLSGGEYEVRREGIVN